MTYAWSRHGNRGRGVRRGYKSSLCSEGSTSLRCGLLRGVVMFSRNVNSAIWYVLRRGPQRSAKCRVRCGEMVQCHSNLRSCKGCGPMSRSHCSELSGYPSGAGVKSYVFYFRVVFYGTWGRLSVLMRLHQRDWCFLRSTVPCQFLCSSGLPRF